MQCPQCLHCSIWCILACHSSVSHACGYGYYYASVIGSGTAELIEGAEKLDALSALMRHMAGREDTFTEDQARGVAVLAIRVRSLSAKAKKH